MLPLARRPSALAGVGLLLVALASLGSACEERPAPASSFYDQQIGPALEFGCVEQTAGCHLASDRGEATGNLDLSSFDTLMRRSDVLPAYGPYSTSLLLIKASGNIDVTVETMDPPDPLMPNNRFVSLRTDIRHNAGATLDISSPTYGEIKRWTESGFLRTGVPDEELTPNQGECVHGVGESRFFDPAADPIDPTGYAEFGEINELLREGCAGTSCHGSSVADLYLTCGDTEEDLRWNYFAAVAHLSDLVSTSPLLRRPLSQLRGGVFHEGGHVFASAEDPVYIKLRAWAERLVERTPTAVRYPEAAVDEGFRFFANRVQPVLVRKGCMFMNCHGVAMFHDLRLRSGSQGQFSRISTERNYEISRHLLGIDSPDANESRLIAKNLFTADSIPGGQGVAHRGGALLEDFGTDAGGIDAADASDCVGVDAANGDLNEVPGYCVLREWHRIEREAAIVSGELLANPVEGIVYVTRPPGAGEVRDFETYRGGAELIIADATLDATTFDLSFTGDRSLNAGCGITADADIRQPAVSWDGTRVAFAARVGAGANWAVYEMAADGTGCAPVSGIGAGATEGNGIAIHDLDPAYAPDGRLVFASTRGNTMGEFPYEGPTLTPAALQANANLYVRDADGSVRQLTFLLNQELAPAFMGDGRAIFTAEKREREFHQLAGRRINLDGGDYHPLFAQRDSVGFRAATDTVELTNRNLAFIAGPIGAEGGFLAVANRSIGPDQLDRPADDRAYISSLHVFDSAVFRNSSMLPNGRVLVACDPTSTDPSAGGFAFEICEVNSHDGGVRRLGGMGASNVDPVAIFARPQNGVFESRVDEANAHTEVIPGEIDTEILIHDFPLLATLVFSNTRIGRPIDSRIDGFDVIEALPPPAGTTDFNMPDDGFGPRWERLEVLGSASLRADGSARIRIPGGLPMLLRPTSGGAPLMFPDGGPLTGEIIQREQMQFYPGERSNQSFRRPFFNGLCGGCHGSISGRELDVAVNIDILTSASQSLARDDQPTNITR